MNVIHFFVYSLVIKTMCNTYKATRGLQLILSLEILCCPQEVLQLLLQEHLKNVNEQRLSLASLPPTRFSLSVCSKPV